MTDYKLQILPGDELLDLVNENDEVIGTVLRSAAHKNNALIHREAWVYIFNDNKQVLLQQRGLNKKIFPGVWVETASGHIDAGDSPESSAHRELSEEMNLKTDLVYFDKFFLKRDIEAAFIYIYYGIYNDSKAISFDKNEVNDVKWIDLDSIADLLRDSNADINTTTYTYIFEIARQLKFI